ncbi:MAG: ABC transporter ATP-binding protein [Kibdelosporangium sp.]
MGSMVVASGVGKRYRSGFEAVRGVDFEVRQGECFGLLGPNGAGKSSLMRMISCVSRVTDGSLRVLGEDTARRGRWIRERIGVVPQDDALDGELTVTENLLVHGRYFGLPKAVIAERGRRLLEFVQLADKADSRVQALSGGMRRRLTIARALINEPDLVLLDEPTTGLDPQARHVLWERLYQLKHRGVTILLTTHYMDEAEQLCDRLVVVDRGVIVAHGTPRQLIDAHSTPEVLELRFRLDELDRALRLLAAHAAAAGRRIEVLPDRVLVYTDDGDKELAQVGKSGLSPLFSLARRSTLEDVFLALTGRTLAD